MLLTAMLAMNTASAMPVDDKSMGIGASIQYPYYSLTLKMWDTLDMLPGIMEDGPGGVAVYLGYNRGGYGSTIHARVNLEKDFWTPPFEFGFAEQAVYYGAGVGIDFTLGYYRNLAVGVRGVIGWQLALNSFPLEIALQIEPGININIIRSYYGLIRYAGMYGLVARYYF
jgi:hypothetical protein